MMIKANLGFTPEEIATGRERLAALRDALRREMPETFLWEFFNILTTPSEVDLEMHPKCSSVGCALGLAHVLWPELKLADRDHGCTSFCDNNAMRAFAIEPAVLGKIFFATDGCYDIAHHRDGVTPELVAQAIDNYLRTGDPTLKRGD